MSRGVFHVRTEPCAWWAFALPFIAQIAYPRLHLLFIEYLLIV